MRTLYMMAAIFIILGASFIYGSMLIDKCVVIDQYKGCWKSVPVTVSSDLCASSPCVARPELQQHNAVVDVLLGACEKARSGNYENRELTRRIEDVTSTFTGYSVDARTLCEQPGLILAKRQYG